MRLPVSRRYKYLQLAESYHEKMKEATDNLK